MSEKELNDILAELRGEGSSGVVKEEFDAQNAVDIFSAKREEKEEPQEKPEVPRNKKPNKNNKKKNNKKIAIIVLAVILIVAIVVGAFCIAKSKKKDTPTTTTTTTTTEQVVKKSGNVNPLTGETGYNKDAIGKRPVAVVVENEYSAESVRPQWGIDEPDIILEGETEYSTRMLMIWADSTDLPDKIGPTRSARPPFIIFSQLFDSVFIHAGLSHTKTGYVGADSVFEDKNVDHINLLNCEEGGKYFDRDKSRTQKWVEHTGFLKGENLPELLESKKIDMKLDESKFSILDFNEKAEALSDTKAENIEFKWSTAACPKTGKYTYDSDDQKYTTKDFDSEFGDANVQWENLIFLLDETEYTTAHLDNGRTETYCDYKLSGGKGMVCSRGTAVEITWGVDNGKLWMKDATGNSVKLNPGKSYIGYGSSNHGGSIEIK